VNGKRDIPVLENASDDRVSVGACLGGTLKRQKHAQRADGFAIFAKPFRLIKSAGRGERRRSVEGRVSERHVKIAGGSYGTPVTGGGDLIRTS
jgi:hypothetical protein